MPCVRMIRIVWSAKLRAAPMAPNFARRHCLGCTQNVNPVEIIEQTAAFAPHERYYWRYQFLLGDTVLVPMLRQMGAFAPGMRVFEFGCGEAGVLGAFAHAGAATAVGIDISAYRVEVGRKIAQACQLPLELEVLDLLAEPVPRSWQQQFDLVILRDVIEHLDDPAHALEVVAELLAPHRWALVTFPPYYSPFGGHQHLLQTRLGMLPWVHVLPRAMFEWIIAGSQRSADREEVRRLRRIRLTIGTFEQAVQKTGFHIQHKQLYLLRPVFQFKFGLPTVALPRIVARSVLAEAVALEALYLLRRPD